MWLFTLLHVQSANLEEVTFMTYTAASHQGMIEILWLDFWEAIMSSLLYFINSLWFAQFRLFAENFLQG